MWVAKEKVGDDTIDVIPAGQSSSSPLRPPPAPAKTTPRRTSILRAVFRSAGSSPVGAGIGNLRSIGGGDSGVGRIDALPATATSVAAAPELAESAEAAIDTPNTANASVTPATVDIASPTPGAVCVQGGEAEEGMPTLGVKTGIAVSSSAEGYNVGRSGTAGSPIPKVASQAVSIPPEAGGAGEGDKGNDDDDQGRG